MIRRIDGSFVAGKSSRLPDVRDPAFAELLALKEELCWRINRDYIR